MVAASLLFSLLMTVGLGGRVTMLLALLTTAALKDNGVAQPACRVAFTEESALEAIEELGYPVVLKPAVGSWGRLLSKINDRDAAETVLEHKTVLGSYHHSIFYIQQYVEKQGRDIRSFGIGLQLDSSISTLAWTQVSLILLVILATVIVSEWVSAKIRHAII